MNLIIEINFRSDGMQTFCCKSTTRSFNDPTSTNAPPVGSYVELLPRLTTTAMLFTPIIVHVGIRVVLMTTYNDTSDAYAENSACGCLS
jgi:hypothetical protein